MSSFSGLQAALKAGRDDRLLFYAFDLLHLDGWDLRPCSLLKRKQVLEGLTEWTGMLRYSEHHVGYAPAMWHSACQMQLEGIICKQANAPYHSGRGGGWVKVKCTGREELIVLGWTPPAGSRVGIGAVHVGYYAPSGQLFYAGGVGSGFDDKELQAFRDRLDGMQTAAPPEGMLVSGDPIDTSITWVQPEIVIEVQYTAWSGAGRVRHPVYRHPRGQGSPRCRARGGRPGRRTGPLYAAQWPRRRQATQRLAWRGSALAPHLTHKEKAHGASGLAGRHRDQNGQIARKHGNALAATLRQTYGPGFAPGIEGNVNHRLVSVGMPGWNPSEYAF